MMQKNLKLYPKLHARTNKLKGTDYICMVSVVEITAATRKFAARIHYMLSVV
jgi:hypothetical protein